MNNAAIVNSEQETNRLSLTESDALFPVKSVPAGAMIPNVGVAHSDYQAIVRTDTNEVLGIHKNNYRLVTNQEVFRAFDSALTESSINLTDVNVCDEVSHLGARAYRTYTFPGQRVAIADENDLVDLKLQIVNSYDGTLAFSTRLGGYRLLCSNGMVIGDTFLYKTKKHTSSFDLEEIISTVNTCIEHFTAISGEWGRWASCSITFKDAERVLTSVPGFNDRIKTAVLGNFIQESQECGSTLWAFYNALTHYSSHAPVQKRSENNVASLRMSREKLVQQAINSEPFKMLAKAA